MNTQQPARAAALVSVVIPAHDEAQGIEHALDVVAGILDDCRVGWEIIVVDDGSRDDTFARVAARAAEQQRIRAVRLSRNFGKEAALLAGLRAAGGDAVVTIDADLQHPPALIPQMLEAWRQGAKVVHAVKRHREHEGFFVRARAQLFNQLLSRLGGVNVRNSSDFKLLDRVAVDAIVHRLPERRRFFRGLTDWVGYENAEIDFDVEQRRQGEGKWSILGLVELAVTALVSFTSAPLRLITIMGFLTLVLGFGLTVETFWALLWGKAVSGFSTIIMTILIIGSFVMISLGIIGEYIAKIYEEVKDRPVYLIDEVVGFDGSIKTKGMLGERPDIISGDCNGDWLDPNV